MEFAHPERGFVYEFLTHINDVPSMPKFLQEPRWPLLHQGISLFQVVHAAFHALIIEFIQSDACRGRGTIANGGFHNALSIPVHNFSITRPSKTMQIIWRSTALFKD